MWVCGCVDVLGYVGTSGEQRARGTGAQGHSFGFGFGFGSLLCGAHRQTWHPLCHPYYHLSFNPPFVTFLFLTQRNQSKAQLAHRTLLSPTPQGSQVHLRGTRHYPCLSVRGGLGLLVNLLTTPAPQRDQAPCLRESRLVRAPICSQTGSVPSTSYSGDIAPSPLGPCAPVLFSCPSKRVPQRGVGA